MPKITQEEKEGATLIPLDRILSGEDDTEAAFNEFRESFNTSDEPGVVRAWELAIDERGNVGVTKMQNRLGSWPIDAYKFDELCQMLIDQYMDPMQTRMAVRLCGTRKEQTGYVFNKIVMLKRALKKESSSNGSESTASLLKMMQENNERIMAMFQRMQAPADKPDVMAEMQRMMAFAQAMNAPMMSMLQGLLPALAGRPLPAADANPFGNLTGLIDVVERLNDLKGDSGGGGGDDNSFAGILRAVTPLVKPGLEAIPHLAAMSAANRPPPRILPAPARPTPPGPAAGAGSSQNPAGATGTAGSNLPVTHPPQAGGNAPTQLTDLPSGDANMLAQLKPQIDSLVQMAEQGSDAVGAADLIFDQVFMNPALSDEIFEQLAGFVDSDKFVGYVAIMNPAAKPHQAWFEAFKTQIVKRLTETDEPPHIPGMPVPPVANTH